MIFRIIFRLIIIALFSYLIFLILLYFRQESVIFYPPSNYKNVEKFGFEEIVIEGGGQKLSALLSHKHPGSDFVLFFYGNASNSSYEDWQIRLIEGMGLNVLVPDYRGYGKSEGRIKKEQDVYDDALLAWEYLVSHQEVEADRIIVWGRSLGVSATAELAEKKKPKALIVESGFSSLNDMRKRYYPYVPEIFLRYKMENSRKLALANAPILVIHSRQDEIISFENGQRIFDSVSEPKFFLEIEGGHNDGVFVSEDKYRQGVKDFFDSLIWP